MSRTKKIVLAILIVFIAMQFIRPSRNSSKTVQNKDMVAQFNVPANVAGILKTSCYDCHSNNTRYPWYANVQPIGWLLANHVKDGKEELNFNEFTTYSNRRQVSKLKEISNQIKDDEMPISSYKMMHKNANLTKEEKSLIKDWINKTADSLSSNN